MAYISPCLTSHPLKYVRRFLLDTCMAESNPDEMSLFPFLIYIYIYSREPRKREEKHKTFVYTNRQ